MRTAAAILLLFQVAACSGDSRVIPYAETRLSQISDEEKAKILAHGPWPPAPRRDPSNRVSGKPEAIALGERLFFEPRLSGTGSVLCATCHVPYRSFQDSRVRAFGLEETDRNTPTLLNVGFYPRWGWEGARDSLWSQSIRPLLEPREMRSSASHVGEFVRTYAAADYEKTFGRPPSADDAEILADVGKALAAFQETLVTRRTAFDEFHDSLQNHASNSYPLAARRGLRIFVRACDTCHAGPGFSSGAIVRGFRVPGLRNVALTAPYMHDGSIAALRDAVAHSSELNLSPSEIDDLVAFLESLTER
jgi:cytochrome c peroxidase